MRIAGLIAFWAGLAAFWVVTVTLVVAKRGDSVPPPQFASENPPAGSKRANESKPANKLADVDATAGADQLPSSNRAGKPIAAPVVADAKKSAKLAELQPEAPAKEKKIKPVSDETEASPALASKPRVLTKSKTQEQDVAAEKGPEALAANAKKPEENKKKRPASIAATTQPAVKDKLEARRSAREKKTGTMSQASSTRTSLVLHVPKNATVYLAGYKTRTTGSVREYATTKLQIGRIVPAYSVRVEVRRGGQTIVKERTIRLRAGQRNEMAIDFHTGRCSRRH